MIPLTLNPVTTTDDGVRWKHIARHLREMFVTGSIFEIRGHLRNPVKMKIKNHLRDVQTISGKFDSADAAANNIVNLEADADSEFALDAVWYTVNGINPAASKRIGDWTMNTMRYGALTTRNVDVDERLYWFADFDLRRPENVNTTEAERQAGYAYLQEILADLVTKGWPEPRIHDSGNGFHCLWLADRSPAGSPVWTHALEYMHQKYSNKILKCDSSVGNSARVTGVPGSWNRKDENLSDTPWRVRRVLHRPENYAVLKYTQVEELAGKRTIVSIPKASAKADGPRPELSENAALLLEDLVEEYNEYLEIVGDPQTKDGGMDYYHLRECPFVGRAHEGNIGKTSITISATAIGFSCFADPCRPKTFGDLRRLLELRSGRKSKVHFYESDDPYWSWTEELQVQYCLELLEITWGAEPEECWVDGQVPQDPPPPQRKQPTQVFASFTKPKGTNAPAAPVAVAVAPKPAPAPIKVTHEDLLNYFQPEPPAPVATEPVRVIVTAVEVREYAQHKRASATRIETKQIAYPKRYMSLDEKLRWIRENTTIDTSECITIVVVAAKPVDRSFPSDPADVKVTRNQPITGEQMAAFLESMDCLEPQRAGQHHICPAYTLKPSAVIGTRMSPITLEWEQE